MAFMSNWTAVSFSPRAALLRLMALVPSRDHGSSNMEGLGIKAVDIWECYRKRRNKPLVFSSWFIGTQIQQAFYHEVLRRDAPPVYNTTSVPAFPMRQALDACLGHASTFIPSTLHSPLHHYCLWDSTLIILRPSFEQFAAFLGRHTLSLPIFDYRPPSAPRMLDCRQTFLAMESTCPQVSASSTCRQCCLCVMLTQVPSSDFQEGYIKIA